MWTVRLPNLTHVLESKGTSRAVEFPASSLRIQRPLSRLCVRRRDASRARYISLHGETAGVRMHHKRVGGLGEAAYERATPAGAGGFGPPTSRVTAGRAAR